jgi:predicted amidohydrolase
MGRIVAQGADGMAEDCQEALVVCEIDSDVVATTRKNMPIYDHRRPELYHALVEQGPASGC